MTLIHTTESQILKTIKQLSTKLIANKTHLLSVESCTGGGLGYYCTSASGSSLWYAGGHITYSNTSKMNLGVPASVLDRYGAVSENTALAMAEAAITHNYNSAQQVGDSQNESLLQYCSLAITGVAGPDGGSAEKPVGTVCFAWITPESEATAATELFTGSRHSIREEAVLYSLTKMVKLIAD